MKHGAWTEVVRVTMYQSDDPKVVRKPRRYLRPTHRPKEKGIKYLLCPGKLLSLQYPPAVLAIG